MRPELNPHRKLHFQADIELANMIELAKLAAGRLYGETTDSFDFTATGILSGFTQTRKLQPITAEPVTAIIALGDLDDIKLVRDKFDRIPGSAVNLGGIALFDFGLSEVYEEYRQYMPREPRSGSIALHYVSKAGKDPVNPYLVAELHKK